MVSVFLDIFIAFSSGDALGGIRCGGKTSLETTRNAGNRVDVQMGQTTIKFHFLLPQAVCT